MHVLPMKNKKWKLDHCKTAGLWGLICAVPIENCVNLKISKINEVQKSSDTLPLIST